VDYLSDFTSYISRLTIVKLLNKVALVNSHHLEINPKT